MKSESQFLFFSKSLSLLLLSTLKTSILFFSSDIFNRNSSSDKIDKLVNGFHNIKLLKPKKNLGYGLANNLAIANKEPLVVAGKFFIQEAKKNNVKLLPVDSEHSSIFQCLNEQHINNLSYITLTASGGPFLNYKKNNFIATHLV